MAAVLDTFKDEPLAIGPTTFTPELHISTTRPITLVQAQGGKFSAVGKATVREFSLD